MAKQKPQLLYGASDIGPSNYGLKIISEAQHTKNWGVRYIGNNCASGDRSVYKGIPFDYAIVGGPSSFEHDLDTYILEEAFIQNKPVYVLGDSPRSIIRPAIVGHIHHASAIVALPSDISPAKKFGYKDAIWLGYPAHWNIDPTTIKPSNIFGSGEGPDPVKMVFVCGMKHAEITDSMLASVIRAMAAYRGDRHIYFQAHPNEIATTQNPARRKSLLASGRVTEINVPESMASIMRTADITVCTGGSTAIMEAALMRLPIVYYTDAKVKQYMNIQISEEVWDAIAAQACEIATDDSMARVLDSLLDTSPIAGWARDLLHAKQEAAFPEQPTGLNVAKSVLDYIENPGHFVPSYAQWNK